MLLLTPICLRLRVLLLYRIYVLFQLTLPRKEKKSYYIFQQNYFQIYLAKFLDTSAKPFFPRNVYISIKFIHDIFRGFDQ